MADWYRNTEWNEEIAADFFERLGRARSQRDQYIVIQALSLAASHPNASLALIDYYFETRTDDFDDHRARMAQTQAHFALGGYEKALDNYLAIMRGEDAERDLYVGSPIEFAFLAARHRSQRHYDAALEHLSQIERPSEKALDPQFRYCAAQAILLHETGRDPARAQVEAEHALAMPETLTNLYPDVAWRLRGIVRH